MSACLLGRTVRFDGGHKRHGFLTGPLADCVDLVPVYPEVGSGMGTPRPPIRLIRRSGTAAGRRRGELQAGRNGATPCLRPAANRLPRRDQRLCFDNWLYILKHLEHLTDRPAKLQESIFDKLFEQAEIASFDDAEYSEYEASLKTYREGCRKRRVSLIQGMLTFNPN